MTRAEIEKMVNQKVIIPSELKGRITDKGFYVEWKTGGKSGGGWRDDDLATDYIANEAEPDFEVLDRILESICPNLTFFQYKRLLSTNNVERGSYTSMADYYDNYSDYNYKFIPAQVVIDAMVETLGIQEKAEPSIKKGRGSA